MKEFLTATSEEVSIAYGSLLKHAMFCTRRMELSNHMCIYYNAIVAVACKKDVGMGLCMFNFVFYVINPAFAYCHAYFHLV